MAWFNHNGVWFRVHGDPGTDEARELMRMAVSDLSLSKTQNVNNLEIVDVNRFPFYQITSHFGKDTIELWPERYAEKKKGYYRETTERTKKEIIPKYFIAFEAYNSSGSQIGYVVCTDGALGGYELLVTDNVVNPHPIYPFSLYANYGAYPHAEYAPDGYSEWGEWFLPQREAANENGIDLVYPFHFPDWKLGTGWAGEGSHYRNHEDPDKYVSLANPYPLITPNGNEEVSYPHTGQPADKFISCESLGELKRTYYDVSQDTKFEEKLMALCSEQGAYEYGLEGADKAFSTYYSGDSGSYGSEIQIHCTYTDPRYSPSSGQIRGVKRSYDLTTLNIGPALMGVSVTEQGDAVKLVKYAVDLEATFFYTYKDQWSYPFIDSMRHFADASILDSLSRIEYMAMLDARAWYEYPSVLTWDGFLDEIGYNPNSSPYSLFTDQRTGFTDSDSDSDSESESYCIIASVAENSLKYAALVEVYQQASLSHSSGSLSSACGKLFSPEYYMDQPGVNESNCTYNQSSGGDEYQEVEFYLDVNGSKLHTFTEGQLGDNDEYRHDGAGYGFIRWWEEANWIALNTSLARRANGVIYTDIQSISTVIYQLWNDQELSKIAEVSFDHVEPSDAFFDGMDREWKENGYQANWHHIQTEDGNPILGPDEEPILCSGHFRCFKVMEIKDPVTTTEIITEGER